MFQCLVFFLNILLNGFLQMIPVSINLSILTYQSFISEEFYNYENKISKNPSKLQILRFLSLTPWILNCKNLDKLNKTGLWKMGITANNLFSLYTKICITAKNHWSSNWNSMKKTTFHVKAIKDLLFVSNKVTNNIFLVRSFTISKWLKTTLPFEYVVHHLICKLIRMDRYIQDNPRKN